MTQSPAITVLMAVHNGDAHLEAALQSVLAQTIRDFEFIIINDASTDTTANILARYATADPRIRIIEHRDNLGLTASLSEGLREARGAYVARMDADDISLPERFATQLQFLEHHPHIACVGSNAFVIDTDGTVVGTKQLPTHPDVVAFYMMLKNYMIHPSVMFRTNIVRNIGGYNEALRYAQDYELWSRLIAAGYSLANIATPLIKYRLHTNSITQGVVKDEAYEAAMTTTRHNITRYVPCSDQECEIFFTSFHKHHVASFSDLRTVFSVLSRFMQAYYEREHPPHARLPDMRRLVRMLKRQAVRWYIQDILAVPHRLAAHLKKRLS